MSSSGPTRRGPDLLGGGGVRRSIVLSIQAEKDAFAREIQRRIEANLQKPSCLRAFRKMWATVVLICRPEEGPSSASPQVLDALRLSTLTLRFDYGELTIHEGRVGRPDITVWGTPSQILELGKLRTLLPGVGAQIFGQGTHLRLVLRLGRLLDAAQRML